MVEVAVGGQTLQHEGSDDRENPEVVAHRND